MSSDERDVVGARQPVLVTRGGARNSGGAELELAAAAEPVPLAATESDCDDDRSDGTPASLCLEAERLPLTRYDSTSERGSFERGALRSCSRGGLVSTLFAFVVVGAACLIIIDNAASGTADSAGAPIGPVLGPGQVESLPGVDGNVALPVRLYAGVAQPGPGSSAQFAASYWLAQSQREALRDPLIVVLGSSPKCSALLAAFRGGGLFHASGTNSVSFREDSWTRRASVLYLELPNGAGFQAQSLPKSKVNWTEEAVGAIAVQSVSAVLASYPLLQAVPLYVAAEGVMTRIAIIMSDLLPVTGLWLGGAMPAPRQQLAHISSDLLRQNLVNARTEAAVLQACRAESQACWFFSDCSLDCESALRQAFAIAGFSNGGNCSSSLLLQDSLLGGASIRSSSSPTLDCAAHRVPSLGMNECATYGGAYLRRRDVQRALGVIKARDELPRHWSSCAAEYGGEFAGWDEPQDAHFARLAAQRSEDAGHTTPRTLILVGGTSLVPATVPTLEWVQNATGISVNDAGWEAWMSASSGPAHLQTAGYTSRLSRSMAFATLRAQGNVPSGEDAIVLLDALINGFTR